MSHIRLIGIGILVALIITFISSYAYIYNKKEKLELENSQLQNAIEANNQALLELQAQNDSVINELNALNAKQSEISTNNQQLTQKLEDLNSITLERIQAYQKCFIYYLEKPEIVCIDILFE